MSFRGEQGAAAFCDKPRLVGVGGKVVGCGGGGGAWGVGVRMARVSRLLDKKLNERNLRNFLTNNAKKPLKIWKNVLNLKKLEILKKPLKNWKNRQNFEENRWNFEKTVEIEILKKKPLKF